MVSEICKGDSVYTFSKRQTGPCNVYRISIDKSNLFLPIEIQAIIHGFDKGYWKRYEDNKKG